MSKETALDWPGMMRLGIGKLGLRPDQFWALTPIELAVMAGLDGKPAVCLRARLDELALAFPDEAAMPHEGEM
ncbi:phage tail assembly chaperone [Aliiroseovarius marinus]|uniref:phage tail assembly chaperone n=1 Tax=Aliiroseovarius marinus TaxID=2500159 RepID=UPI003D7D2BAE